MAEYYEVLHRPKFSRFQDFLARSEHLLADIEIKSSKFIPSIKLDIISDKNDNKIIELADECNADFVITGNSTDFTFSEYKSTKIVSPAEYWEIYKPIK
jgi:putative PIN family toxin of toxin-antitoxin system